MPPLSVKPADAGVRDQAARRREPELLGRPVDGRPRGAALDERPGRSGSTRTSFIGERSIITPPSRDGVAGDVVAAAADRDRLAVLPGERHRRDHVRRRPAPDDHAGRRSIIAFQTARAAS